MATVIDLPSELPPLTPRERRFVALLAFGDPIVDEDDRPCLMTLNVAEAGRRCGWGVTQSYNVLHRPQVQAELVLLQRAASVEASAIAAQAVPSVIRRLVEIVQAPKREDGPAVKAVEVLLKVAGIRPIERTGAGAGGPLESYTDAQILEGLRATLGQMETLNVQVNVAGDINVTTK